MATAKITQSVTQAGDSFTVEDAEGEVHTGLSLDEAANLLDVSTAEIKQAIAEGQGGVGYIDTDEDEPEEDEEEEEDK